MEVQLVHWDNVSNEVHSGLHVCIIDSQLFSELKANMQLSQVKVGLFRLVFFCLGLISISQLWRTFKSWEDHPIESFTLKVPKDKIPFPSVTVCPEGFGLWSGLRSFLNRMEFTDHYKSRLPLAYSQFVQIKFEVASNTVYDIHVEDCFANDRDPVGNTRYEYFNEINL